MPIMQDPQNLIVRAFQEAHHSGKPQWRKMTIAVLKNRLLDLTGRDFDEASYGASSFMDLVLRYPDMLQVDDSVFPPVVELYGAEGDRLSSTDDDHKTTYYHIRSDLWRAVLDYSSGMKYVWDFDKNQARPSQGSELSPVIDTTTADIQRLWRQQFLDEVKQPLNLSLTEMRESDEWLQLQLGTSHLPARLIPRWNRFFRDKVLDHLRSWFSGAGIAVPDDMVSSARSRKGSSPSETENLRELVISVAHEMTHDELSELKLPSEAVLRATKRRRQ